MPEPADLTCTYLCQWPTPEVFFLTSFRCLLTGYERWDAMLWEKAWLGARRIMPLTETKRTMADLTHFTRVFRSSLRRNYMFMPVCCGHAGVEECETVRLIGAAQKGLLVATRLIAHRLTQNADHIELVDAALELGRSLHEASLIFTLAFEQDRDIVASGALH
jgi:hypothetical protein